VASKIASLASEKTCFASQQSSLNGCSQAPAYKRHKAPQGAAPAALHSAAVQQINNAPADRFGNDRCAVV
jgi:hypothetical protein